MYYPPNKIKTDLYTNGDEYRIVGTYTPYTGPYFSTFEGAQFTGNGPNDKSVKKLVPLRSPNIQAEYENSYPVMYIDKDSVSDDVIIYQVLNEKGNPIKRVPYFEYPKPTEENYKMGEFQRFFVIKANENIFIEMKEKQYKLYENKNNGVAWKYYTPFSLFWQLTGTKEHVYQTNQKLTVLAEKEIKRTGLQQFLKENYLKFYKEA